MLRFFASHQKGFHLLCSPESTKNPAELLYKKFLVQDMHKLGRAQDCAHTIKRMFFLTSENTRAARAPRASRLSLRSAAVQSRIASAF